MDVDLALSAAYTAPASEGAPFDPTAHPPMRLDASAKSALNLLPSSDRKEALAAHSLFGVLNHGRTAMSSRLLQAWIASPLTDLDAITRRQNYVDLLMNEHDLFASLFETHLRHLPDLDKVVSKLRSWGSRSDPKKLDQEGTIKNLVAAYGLATKYPAIVTQLANYTGEHAEMVSSDIVTPSRDSLLPDLDLFRQLISSSVDLRAAQRHEYRMNPATNPGLQSVDNKLSGVRDEMEDGVREAAMTMGLEESRVKLTTSPNAGWCFRVTRKDEKALREHAQFITVETKKDGFYFTTKSQRLLNTSYTNYQAQFAEMQHSIVVSTMDIAYTHTHVFEAINRIITELDVLLGMAHAAKNAPIPYVRPTVMPMGSGVIELREARHPCVEAAYKEGSFIPNDVVMKKEDSRFQGEQRGEEQ